MYRLPGYRQLLLLLQLSAVMKHKAVPGASRYLGRYTRTFGLFGRKRGQKKSPTIVGLLFVRIFSCLHLDKQSRSTT